MAGLSPLPRMIFWDANGDPVPVGSKLYTYVAGTTTPKPTYTNQGGGSTNPNPLDLDGADGDDIWFDGAYKIDVKDADGVSLPGYPIDNVVVYDLLDWSDLTATIADLNATDTSVKSVTDSIYALIASDRGKTLLCDTTSNAITINLLSAVVATNGYEVTIKKSNVSPTNFVTIDGNNSETIEGRLTFILYDQNDVVTILCDGNNWRVKSAVIRGNVQYISTTYTTTISDINKTLVCSASADYTVTLLSAATAGDGFRQIFKKSSDAFNITLDPAGSETIDDLSNFTLSSPWQILSIVSNGTNWLIENNVGNAGVNKFAFEGFSIANNSGDTNHDIDFNTGDCYDSTSQVVITLSSTLTKRIDATWAAGTNQGGLFSGTVAISTTYHLFVIYNPTTNVTDCGFDTSLTAANRPAGYTYYRRVASLYTDSSANLVQFVNYKDQYLLDVPVQDYDVANPGTSAVTPDLSIPNDIKLGALITIFLTSINPGVFVHVLITDPDLPDTPPLDANCTMQVQTAALEASSNIYGVFTTSTSGQIRIRLDFSNADVSVSVNTRGWMDDRGRFGN